MPLLPFAAICAVQNMIYTFWGYFGPLSHFGRLGQFLKARPLPRSSRLRRHTNGFAPLDNPHPTGHGAKGPEVRPLIWHSGDPPPSRFIFENPHTSGGTSGPFAPWPTGCSLSSGANPLVWRRSRLLRGSGRGIKNRFFDHFGSKKSSNSRVGKGRQVGTPHGVPTLGFGHRGQTMVTNGRKNSTRTFKNGNWTTHGVKRHPPPTPRPPTPLALSDTLLDSWGGNVLTK